MLSETEIDSETSLSNFPKYKIKRIIFYGLTLTIIFILGNWLYYQSQHVLSRNAVVKGQITEVGTRFNGLLATIEANDGEQVKAGQILARLYDKHIEAEVQEIQAKIEGLEREIKLEQSTIEYERTRRTTQIQESIARSAEADAEVAAAKSRADEAQAFYKARLEMLKRQLISRDTMRQAEAEHRTALALLNAVQAKKAAATSARKNANLELESLDLRVQHLEVLDSNLRASRAQLKRAQADLEATLVRAPDDGTIIRWLIKTGGSVRVGMPVVLMSIGSDTWIEAWIDEDQVHLVKTENLVTVTLPSHPGQEFKGIVDAIGVATDFEQPIDAVPQPRATRMRNAPVISILVRLQAAPATLLPGLSATVAILRDRN
ncbi:MAG: efflux RND transporter periplasmic adaptor subunit [Nitrosomonas sp.]|nr:efflux RND transporter periplasmic adaptor subunit [Nitrosomonas sp.]